MTEHKMLKDICNKIQYTWISEIAINAWCINYPIVNIDKSVGVREIIFTQEFMDKYKRYIINDNGIHEEYMDAVTKHWRVDYVLYHLDAPVTYLYNLLGLWQKQENK